MNKVLASVALATGMVLMSTAVASAATTAPTIKIKKTVPKSGNEGTATHEMSETSKKQTSEASETTKKISANKLTIKKAAVKKK